MRIRSYGVVGFLSILLACGEQEETAATIEKLAPEDFKAIPSELPQTTTPTPEPEPTTEPTPTPAVDPSETAANFPLSAFYSAVQSQITSSASQNSAAPAFISSGTLPTAVKVAEVYITKVRKQYNQSSNNLTGIIWHMWGQQTKDGAGVYFQKQTNYSGTAGAAGTDLILTNLSITDAESIYSSVKNGKLVKVRVIISKWARSNDSIYVSEIESGSLQMEEYADRTGKLEEFKSDISSTVNFNELASATPYMYKIVKITAKVQSSSNGSHFLTTPAYTSANNSSPKLLYYYGTGTNLTNSTGKCITLEGVLIPFVSSSFAGYNQNYFQLAAYTLSTNSVYQTCGSAQFNTNATNDAYAPECKLAANTTNTLLGGSGVQPTVVDCDGSITY